MMTKVQKVGRINSNSRKATMQIFNPPLAQKFMTLETSPLQLCMMTQYLEHITARKTNQVPSEGGLMIADFKLDAY